MARQGVSRGRGAVNPSMRALPSLAGERPFWRPTVAQDKIETFIETNLQESP